jgi:hypothetical protein
MSSAEVSSEGPFASYPSLRGKVVLISGGATGLGAEFVAQFAAQGAHAASLTSRTTPARRWPVRSPQPALRRLCTCGPMFAISPCTNK